MTKPKKKLRKDKLGEIVRKGSQEAINKLILERQKTDDYLIISRNGKVVKVKARSLKIIKI
jgi:hypothetical protein